MDRLVKINYKYIGLSNRIQHRFTRRRIPRDGFISILDWPPYSPDLNFLDYSIWEELEKEVCSLNLALNQGRLLESVRRDGKRLPAHRGGIILQVLKAVFIEKRESVPNFWPYLVKEMLNKAHDPGDVVCFRFDWYEWLKKVEKRYEKKYSVLPSHDLHQLETWFLEWEDFLDQNA